MSLTSWSGAVKPERHLIEGRYVRLEPLDASHHHADLLRLAWEDGAEDRFRYLFDTAPDNEASFASWFANAAASQDPMFFAVVDKASGHAEGRQALMRVDSTHGVIEIGNILWGSAIARTRMATEAFYLTARYVFDTLGYRRFEWKCDNRNLPSKRAAERFGFTFEGVFRQHMVVKSQSRDTAWFSIIDADWPVLSSALTNWLDPANFDPNGVQRRRLESFRA